MKNSMMRIAGFGSFCSCTQLNNDTFILANSCTGHQISNPLGDVWRLCRALRCEEIQIEGEHLGNLHLKSAKDRNQRNRNHIYIYIFNTGIHVYIYIYIYTLKHCCTLSFFKLLPAEISDKENSAHPFLVRHHHLQVNKTIQKNQPKAWSQGAEGG